MILECGPDESAAVKRLRRWRGNFIGFFDFVAAIHGGVVFRRRPHRCVKSEPHLFKSNRTS